MKIFLLTFVAMSTLFGTTDNVRMTVGQAELSLENGSPASFEIRLKAGEGIHINAQPPITIETRTKGVELSVAELPKTGNYLDVSRPVRISCKTDGLKPGVHRVDFVVGFTYCSDKEGWCSMGKDSSTIEIRVRK